KEAEEHEQYLRSTQGDAPPSASLALGYHRSRFQRFCRCAAEMHDEKRLLWIPLNEEHRFHRSDR
ncbi:MAG: hypothetical protein WCR33_05965, partial [Bacilli bacterium]